MKKIWSKALILVLAFGTLLPLSPLKAAENRMSRNKSVLTVNASGEVYAVSKKSGIKLRKKLINDLNVKFEEIDKRYNYNVENDLGGHGEFYAYIPFTNLVYVFDGFDPDLDYKLRPDSPCIRIEGSAKDILSGFKKKMSVKSFAKALKKQLYNIKYEILEGGGTSYYISDIYADITFTLKKSDKKVYCLTVALDKDNNIAADTQMWLLMKNSSD